jgi:hypothetical protein
MLGPLSKLNVYIDTARRGIDVECELHFITRALPSLLHATFNLMRSWKVGRLGGGRRVSKEDGILHEKMKSKLENSEQCLGDVR